MSIIQNIDNFLNILEFNIKIAIKKKMNASRFTVMVEIIESW